MATVSWFWPDEQTSEIVHEINDGTLIDGLNTVGQMDADDAGQENEDEILNQTGLICHLKHKMPLTFCAQNQIHKLPTQGRTTRASFMENGIPWITCCGVQTGDSLE